MILSPETPRNHLTVFTGGIFPVASAAMLLDGSVVVAGSFRLAGGSTDYALAKLTATGAFDGLFTAPVAQNLAQPSRPAVISNARVSPEGKIWVFGRFDAIGGIAAPRVARLNSDGTRDSTFSLTGVGYYDSLGDSVPARLPMRPTSPPTTTSTARSTPAMPSWCARARGHFCRSGRAPGQGRSAANKSRSAIAPRRAVFVFLASAPCDGFDAPPCCSSFFCAPPLSRMLRELQAA